ncbi:MAG: CRTAC1 family protein [Acidobacteriota bacterium]|nr:CRTAC1 family protein [Acidobacteriota bacterium]MDH3783987.1 CRTAC1 family protein [Acidobacteriota bacterium]
MSNIDTRRRPFVTAVALGALVVIAAGCSEPAPADLNDAPDAKARPGRPQMSIPDVSLVDRARDSGLTFTQVAGDKDKGHLPETLGSGVAIADYDRDGDLDIYLGTGQPRVDWLAGKRPLANGLFRNKGDGSFEEVGAAAGVDLHAWTLGTYFVDYDGDDDEDLFLSNWGANVLYRNDGDGTFTDVSVASGIGAAQNLSASAAFGDLDGDGDLDLWVASYCVYDMANPPADGQSMIWRGIEVFMGPSGYEAQRDEVYVNNGDGTFTEVSRQAGVDVDEAYFGLGIVFSDVDLDGDLDVYVANDSVANGLWVNDSTAEGLRFRDAAFESGVATNESAAEQAGMGVDAADYDGDGVFDLVVTNFSHDFNTLYQNLGDLLFLDTTFEAGFSDSFAKLAWGAKWFDYDNDGALDLVIAAGHTYPAIDDLPQVGTTYHQQNMLYRNRGDGAFDEIAGQAGDGMALVMGSRGIAVADIDEDGDLDMVVTNIDDMPTLLINEGGNQAGHWLRIRLQGGDANRAGIGARVELESGGRRWVREMNPFGSYLSGSEAVIHVGVGDVTSVERLTVHWPSGHVDTHEAVAVDQTLTLSEGAS